ncbi:hypothetical protein BpHYR1_028679 [Brachionus plicatilis]|uniref:Uncharacterized protein n=1 Tax=Brachionus plicatilis TaxID=10195 RepID=A0A3M7T9G0_BRAPC|nr:hypothetical protein BpHYR1_028679 [Brachionus plicatilis]
MFLSSTSSESDSCDSYNSNSFNWSLKFKGYQISRFGSYDPSKNITNVLRNQVSGIISLASTEVKFDTNLVGYEAFAAIGGTVSFRIIQYDDCLEDSCFSKVFRDSPVWNPKLIIREQAFTLVPGYNRIQIAPISIKKGYILNVLDYSRVLAVNATNDSTIMSDYLIVALTSRKLNMTENWRLYSSAIHSIEANISNSTVNLVRHFKNWYHLTCWDLDHILDLMVNCTLFIKSRSKSDSYEVDYGNGQIKNFSFSDHTKNFVGMTLPDEAPTKSTWNANYLMLNTEFVNDTWIYGFEYFASLGGTVKFVLYSPTFCVRTSRCADQLMKDPIKALTFTYTIWVTTVFEGKNRFYLTQPVMAKKGDMLYLESIGFTARFFYDTNRYELYEDMVINGTANYLHKIELWKKSNILINVLTEPKLYSDTVPISVNYSSIGNYNITVKNKNSLAENLITKELTISKNQTIDLYCKDNNRTINNTINCVVIASSFSKSDRVLTSNQNLYSLSENC